MSLQKIIDILKINCKIIKKQDTDSPGVMRPLNSRLSLTKIKAKFNLTPRNWEDALKDCIKKII